MDAEGGASERVVELFRALAHPTRLQILQLLQTGPRAVHELVDGIGCAQATCSQHLMVLRAARLVICERCGREVRYELADEHVAHIVQDALQHVGEPH